MPTLNSPTDRARRTYLWAIHHGYDFDSYKHMATELGVGPVTLRNQMAGDYAVSDRTYEAARAYLMRAKIVPIHGPQLARGHTT